MSEQVAFLASSSPLFAGLIDLAERASQLLLRPHVCILHLLLQAPPLPSSFFFYMPPRHAGMQQARAHPPGKC
uniref:Uncharacterized protein n=1 Tax=Oryza brachyantha TaxID=4533 RepID=J3LJI5_ORYBR